MASQLRTVYTDSPPSSTIALSTHPTVRIFIIVPLKAADGGRFVEEFDIHGSDSQIDVPYHLKYIPRDIKAGLGRRIWDKVVHTFKRQ